MAVRPAVDRRSVLTGGAVGVVVAVAVFAVAQLLDAAVDLDDSNWVFALVLLLIAGWVAAGVVAARREPDAPLTHGLLAGLVAFAPLVVLGIVFNVAEGEPVPVGAMLAFGILAATAGIVGGLLAARRA